MAIRQRHYVNHIDPGQLGFFTTTALDFAHVFRRPEMREEMTLSLLEDLRRTGASLHGFVVMTHHLHLVVRTPADRSGSDLMMVIKRNAAKRILPLLNENENAQLAQQKGLNRRSFWKPSFRSLLILDQRVLLQKLDYVHSNPVRAGYCEEATSYRWSSAWAWQDERFAGQDYALDLEAVLREFQASRHDASLPWPRGLASTESGEA